MLKHSRLICVSSCGHSDNQCAFARGAGRGSCLLLAVLNKKKKRRERERERVCVCVCSGSTYKDVYVYVTAIHMLTANMHDICTA